MALANSKPTVIKSVPNTDHHHQPRPAPTDEQRKRVRALLAGAEPWVDAAMVIHYGNGIECCGKRHDQ